MLCGAVYFQLMLSGPVLIGFLYQRSGDCSSSVPSKRPPADASLPSAGPDSGNPFGASRLCGSYWIEPQFWFWPLAHAPARLTGPSV
ncbi:hypothetical protein AFB00_18790 [Pseudonocardia sp. HH130630-07]|nr:hypothetical protein AFB00_18790 [Pseudonocardia sp. HH130630-07]